MIKKYKLLYDRFEHKAGTIVYKSAGHDYGLARDDTNYTGVEHISVTLKEDGGYPFFTVPTSGVQSIGYAQLYDSNLAESITNTGQNILQELVNTLEEIIDNSPENEEE